MTRAFFDHFLAWVREHIDLRRKVREQRAIINGLKFQLVVIEKNAAMWQELSRCDDPRRHARLAHDLQLAQAELQELRDEDPHTASLDERGDIDLVLVAIVGALLLFFAWLVVTVTGEIDDVTTRDDRSFVAPVQAEDTTTTTTPPTSTTAAPVVRTKRASVTRAWTWDDLARCESNGRWDLDAFHDGGLQFAVQTWASYAPADFPPYAYQATREQQILVAERVLADQGARAWPVCSRKVGMR